VFLSIKTLTQLFCLTIPNLIVLFMVLNRKFNKDSKNVLKRVIFSVQVEFYRRFNQSAKY